MMLDNQLPQGDSGELTRHININQLNITEYSLVKDNGEDGGVECVMFIIL